MRENRKPAQRLGAVLLGFILSCCVAGIAASQSDAPARRAREEAKIGVSQGDIGGAVNGPNGPEAGVWVIAETADLPTKFRKIVVTDDRGRFLVPGLPKANYKVWVRGYGLIDSAPVLSGIGKTLVLKATPAPDARAAAQVYPANYWYSLLQIPSPSEFPFLKPERSNASARGRRENGQASVLSGGIHNQAEWLFAMKPARSAINWATNSRAKSKPAWAHSIRRRRPGIAA